MPETLRDIIAKFLDQYPDIDPYDDEAHLVDSLVPLAETLVGQSALRWAAAYGLALKNLGYTPQRMKLIHHTADTAYMELFEPKGGTDA